MKMIRRHYHITEKQDQQIKERAEQIKEPEAHVVRESLRHYFGEYEEPEPVVPVVFRKFPQEKETDRLDVVAFFPGTEHESRPGLIASYQHIGQHSAADPELIHTLSRCTYSEYEPLFRELTEQVGYRLHVLSDYEAAKACRHCGSIETEYNLKAADSRCQSCGEWQE